MNTIGNVIWVLFGGLLLGLMYFIGGLILCVTLVGIPFGYQAMKIGVFALMPFGRTTVFRPEPAGCLSTLMNILWILVGGIWIAVAHLVIGGVFCVTIIGIPFGLQHFKLMSVALTPFGRVIVPV